MAQQPETREAKCVRVRIQGRVQGVGFRSWVERTADRLDLRGWVRNRRDGTVEAIFSGPAAVVEDMVDRCRFGPRSSKVSGVQVVPERASDLEGFEIRATE